MRLSTLPVRIIALCAAALVSAARPATASPHAEAPATDGDNAAVLHDGAPEGTASPTVHDPVMAECDGRYYIFCTGQGISVLVSDDMRTWRDYGSVFDETPEWTSRIPRFEGHMWAPDIIRRDGLYHLYYTCSTFGSNRSAIGHAVNVTLDRDDPAYRWVDTGMVIESEPRRDDWNAIDPAVAFDEEGAPWLSFGSFWSGIELIRLSDDMSRPEESARPVRLAARDRSQSPENAIEAPFIFRRDGYFYLFVSLDACCRGAESTYRMAVGRSEKIDGPYLDRRGRRMTDGASEPITSSSDTVAASGHCAVYTFGGRDLLAAHAYDARDGRPFLIIREIEWDAEGWPRIKF